MKAKRLLIGILIFIAFVVVIGVTTARRIQEGSPDAFVDVEQELIHNEEIERGVKVALPRLPENSDHLETTPEVVSNTSSGSGTPPSFNDSAESAEPRKILLSVPFTSQAPTGKWVDARFQDGCEEAASLMAMRWAEGRSLSPQEAEKEIIATSEYEQKMFGTFHDTSAEDTVERIFRGYFKYENVEARSDITTRDIRNELTNGNLVIVPVNGRKIGNPYYTSPGPLYHNLVIIGYDPATDEFITNDPGTRRGKGYRYSSGALENALQVLGKNQK